ncbi:MAG: hypothetical protein M3Z30_10955 [Gemmatimonadota bacterium]|nr:hypothetical protein [Gemmatimonadota bacterium]
MDSYTAHTIIRDGTFVALAAIFGIGLPLARAYARRMDRGMAPPRVLPSADASDARMERVERSVEAIALEVERIAEGQRFLTRLLSEPDRVRPTERIAPARGHE